MIGLALLSGCKDKDSTSNKSGAAANATSSNAAADPTSISGEGDAEAVKAMNEELAKRWTKTQDGWVSEYPSKTYIATGERAGPESFYRQIKELKFQVQPDEISEADKLNGFQFQGTCQFNPSSVRTYNDPNAFGPPRWSDWHTVQGTVHIDKRKGQWLFSGIQGYLVNGTKPDAGTLSKLK
jgi:hypothetical protein